MKISKSKAGGFLVVTLSGQLDSLAASKVQAELRGDIDGGEKWLVIDLTDVNYISSAGVATTIVLARLAKAAGGQVRICGLSGAVRETFDVTGVSLRLEVFPTQAEAMEGFPPS